MRWAVVAVSLLAGCNVVRMRERAMATKVERAGLEQAQIVVGADSVRVWHGGRGRPVLFLHGFGASALWQWHDQVRGLARDHRLVVPDLLGFGGSSGPGGDPSLDHQVAVVLGVLDQLGLERVDVVGVSYGGLVGYALAGMHPERVRRLVMVDSPGHAWSRADHQAMLRRFGVGRADELLVPKDPDGIRTLVRVASRRRQWVPDWVARQVIAELYDPHRDDQIALLRHLEGDIDHFASTIARPTSRTLVVWGDGDPVFPVAVGHRLGRDLSARVEEIPRARHLPNAEHPRCFNAIVREFLAAP